MAMPYSRHGNPKRKKRAGAHKNTTMIFGENGAALEMRTYMRTVPPRARYARGTWEI